MINDEIRARMLQRPFCDFFGGNELNFKLKQRKV